MFKEIQQTCVAFSRAAWYTGMQENHSIVSLQIRIIMQGRIGAGAGLRRRNAKWIKIRSGR